MMEMLINAAWFDLAWMKVPVEKPHWLLLIEVLGAVHSLTCKDGFVGFELLPSDIKAAVCET